MWSIEEPTVSKSDQDVGNLMSYVLHNLVFYQTYRQSFFFAFRLKNSVKRHNVGVKSEKNPARNAARNGLFSVYSSLYLD